VHMPFYWKYEGGHEDTHVLLAGIKNIRVFGEGRQDKHKEGEEHLWHGDKQNAERDGPVLVDATNWLL